MSRPPEPFSLFCLELLRLFLLGYFFDGSPVSFVICVAQTNWCWCSQPHCLKVWMHSCRYSCVSKRRVLVEEEGWNWREEEERRRENTVKEREREREMRGLGHLFFIEQFFGSSSSVISIARHASQMKEKEQNAMNVYTSFSFLFYLAEVLSCCLWLHHQPSHRGGSHLVLWYIFNSNLFLSLFSRVWWVYFFFCFCFCFVLFHSLHISSPNTPLSSSRTRVFLFCYLCVCVCVGRYYVAVIRRVYARHTLEQRQTCK